MRAVLPCLDSALTVRAVALRVAVAARSRWAAAERARVDVMPSSDRVQVGAVASPHSCYNIFPGAPEC